jgi:CubicO group peptidase (beta-lactamase class C family)
MTCSDSFSFSPLFSEKIMFTAIMGSLISLSIVGVEPVEMSQKYREGAAKFESLVEKQLQAGLLTGASTVWVDDQNIVYARGFGLADPRQKTPARPDTVYRAGSISKLFTAMAVMQLAEEGKLDIDRPVADYAPEFRLVSPFENVPPITPRLLMCHRSGMFRESPVGGYLDPTQPGLAASVASIADCVLAVPPNTKTKYSNIGASVNGWLIEKLCGVPYAEHMQRRILGPLDMKRSAYLLNDSVRKHLAAGQMRVADGSGGFQPIEAPRFELGTIPAGNLYTTAEDLSRFLRMLFAEGRFADQRLLRPETLQKMFTPQAPGGKDGYGLGFSPGKFREHQTIGHMGEVYGYTAQVLSIPKLKLGVILLSNDDIASGPVAALSQTALGLMVAAKTGGPPPEEKKFIALPPADLSAYAGEFESESFWAKITIRGGQLKANISGQEFSVTPIAADRFWGNGRTAFNVEWNFQRDADGSVRSFEALGQTFCRVDPRKSPEIPEAWKDFLGAYGPEFIPLVVSAKHGHLYAMTENMYDYRLTPLNRTVFKLPTGMYHDEHVVFLRDEQGRVHTALFANMPLKRLKKLPQGAER